MNADELTCEECMETWLDHSAVDETAAEVNDSQSNRGAATEADARMSAHLQSCETCRAEVASLRRESAALQDYFSSVRIPPAVKIRGALQSASGHPRRTSLTVLPTLIWLMLLALLGVAALGWVLMTRLRGGS